MAIAALITWIITAGGGLVLLARWVSHGGHRAGSGTRLVPGLVFGHVALAVIGLLVWVGYLITDQDALAWAAFVLLLPVAGLGLTMFARWLPARRTDAAESHFPVPVVAAHGVIAVTTVVLVLLTALGVGES